MQRSPDLLAIEVHCCVISDMRRWGHTPYAQPYWRIYHNAVKGWSINQSGRVTELTPERVIVVPPEVVYTTDGTCPTSHLFIHFSLRGLAAAPRGEVVAVPVRDAVAGAIEALRSAPAELPRWQQQALTLAVIGASIGSLPRTQLVENVHGESVAVAIAHLAGHLDRPVSNDELAELVGMNTNAFIRRFRHEIGDTPHRYHLRARIDRAAIELVHTEDPIEDIASKTGFCDRHHFSRVFSRYRGMAPARYRASLRRHM